MKNKRHLLLLTITIALCVVAAAVYIKFTQTAPSVTSDQQELQRKRAQATDYDPNIDNEADRRGGQAAQLSGTNQTSPQSISPNGNNSQVKPTITSYGQSGSTVYVNAIVDGQQSGTCTLTISKSGFPTVTKSAPLGLVTNYYACQGFNINRSEFATNGDWNAIIQFSNRSTSGTSDSKNIAIQ